MERSVTYFDSKGEKNTGRCLEICKGLYAEGYRHFVVASTGGNTGLLFAESFKGTDANLVVVTHSAGFKEPGKLEIGKETVEKIRSLGAKVYTGTILTHSIETSLMNKHQGIYPAYIVTQTLRRFSQGVKVGVEIVMEACDAGLIPEAEEIVTVGGTGRGADTILIVESAASKRFLDLKVLEIVAKPRK